MKTLRMVPILCVAIAAGCAPAEAPDDDGELATGSSALCVSHDVARKTLLATDALLAASMAQLGQADGLWPWMADDAAYLHPGAEVIVGRDAARGFLRATYPDPQASVIRLHTVTGDVSSDALLGYTFGWYDETSTVDGVATTTYGRYLATWRRDAAPWRLAAFMRRTAVAAPAPPPADAGIIAGEHGTPIPGDPVALRQQVLATDAAFAALSVAQGYSVAFPAYAADDAVTPTGRDYRWNKPAVASFWAGWTPAETFDWGPSIAGAAASGDLAYTIGTATYDFDDGTSSVHFGSKYLTVWIRLADGSWRWLVDDGNATP
jgi:ketosteroid isomerase-like protein